jgi:hypothetical protein
MKKEKFKNKILFISSIFFIVLNILYFMYRDVNVWIVDIIPEFMGTILLGFFIILALKRGMSLKLYISIIGLILFLGTMGYAYGIMNDIRFLTDLSPELLGSTGISLVLSIIFKRKIWQ